MSTVIRTTGCILTAVAMLACQGPEGPMGPASSPKTTQSDSTATDSTATDGCVVINISGETVVYQGDNPDTNTITVYDTVTVDSTSGSVLGLEFTFLSEVLYTADYEQGGWTVEGNLYTPETVQAVYFRRGSISKGGTSGTVWMEFSEYMRLHIPALYTKPTYEIGDGEIFISDPDEAIFFGYIGILLDPEGFEVN